VGIAVRLFYMQYRRRKNEYYSAKTQLVNSISN